MEGLRWFLCDQGGFPDHRAVSLKEDAYVEIVLILGKWIDFIQDAQRDEILCVSAHECCWHRQRVCSRDEIVILLVDRLGVKEIAWKRKGSKEYYLRDKAKKRGKWEGKVLVRLQSEMSCVRAPKPEGTKLNMCVSVWTNHLNISDLMTNTLIWWIQMKPLYVCGMMCALCLPSAWREENTD